MAEVRNEWVDLALHKGPEIDKEEAEAGVKWLYYSANLKEPEVVFVDGPKDFTEKLGIRDSVGASVGDSVRASVGDSVWDSVRASVSWSSLAYDADWGAWYEYWKKIKVIDHEKANKYIGYLRSGAFFVMFFEKKAFVMCRPTQVEQDERKRLHSLTGPALAFKDGTEIYKINGVGFEKDLWERVAGGKLAAQEVFALENMEQRRIAYELMDKKKMLELGAETLDEVKDDGYGNPMKVISFSVKGFDQPFLFLNCFCPSTGREYFLQTDEKTCVAAKNKSFGLEEVSWIKEW